MNRTTYRALPKTRPVAPVADALRYTITAKGLHALAALGSPVPAPAAPVTRNTWRPRPVEAKPAAAPPACKACDKQPADVQSGFGLCAACEPYFDSYAESLAEYRARVQTRAMSELEAFAPENDTAFCDDYADGMAGGDF